MRRETVTLPQLHSNQVKIKQEADRFNAVDCGRRWGKTVLAIDLISETSINGYPAGYFAPTYKLLEGTFKDTIKALNPIVSRKHDNQFIELVTGGVIDFWSLDNKYAGRSRKYKRVIVDEAAFVKDLAEVWNNSIRPSLTDMIGDGWMMSTPRGKNDFYKFYHKGQSGEERWKSWQMPTHTNPYINKQELEDAKRDLPEAAYNQEYLALFSDNAANPFGIEHINRAIAPLSGRPPILFGVDLAKSVDWTVVVGLDQDGRNASFDRWQSDWGQTKRRIAEITQGYPALVDSTGIGDAIVEDLQRVNPAIEGYVFTSKSKQILMEGLAAGVQGGTAEILPGVMQSEFESFEFEYGRTGVKYTAPTGMHDDTVCAKGLAHHHFGHHSFSGPFVQPRSTQ